MQASMVNEICVLFKIRQMRTTSYHPQTDGLVERFNRTLCDMLACYVHDEPEEWDKYLPFVTFAYNTAIQSTLKECPFYLFFGRSPLLPNDIKINSRYDTRYDDQNVYAEKWENAKKLARDHLFKAQTKQKEYYDKGTKTCLYSTGQMVLLKPPPSAGKFINRWNGPFVITRSFSNINYEIASIPESKQRRAIVHANRLKPYTPRATEISPNIQRERMKEPNKTEPIPVGIQSHEESFHHDQPIKRGRGRPRKITIQPTPIPTKVPNQGIPSNPNNIRHASTPRDNATDRRYGKTLQRGNNNYPNTRSTRSANTPIDVPDFPVTQHNDEQYTYPEPQNKSPLQQTRYNLRKRY